MEKLLNITPSNVEASERKESSKLNELNVKVDLFLEKKDTLMKGFFPKVRKSD